MRPGWVLAALLTVPGVLSGQATAVLRITVTLPDADRSLVPVPRHVLLVSDNPATSEPRRILTRADGTVEIALRPGNYTIESDRPVVMLGKAYQWTQILDVAAGRDAVLNLTAENAEVMPLPESAPAAGAAPADTDVSLRFGKWQQSLVTVWSPTTAASGFVVDARGLVMTDGHAVGNATAVEVQVSPLVKVAARVLHADATRGVAVVWVDPASVASRLSAPPQCPPSSAAATLDEGFEIVAMTAPMRGPMDAVTGEVTTLGARAVDTDLRLGFGGAGGPVFNTTGDIVGLTSVRPDDDPRRRNDVAVVRAGVVCEALSMAREKLSVTAPPDPDRLPIEPARRAPAAATAAPAPARASDVAPPVISSSDFDVALITPLVLERARQRADWTGGASGRSAEAEARLGRLTDFGAWSEYFADLPPVLVVRVTPKLVEGFWKRLAREAARTQGAELPPFKDFTASFIRLQASCGAAAVTPIHPFVIEHRVSPKQVVREGLYVFDPEAFGPRCGAVTLSLYSEKDPQRASTVTIPAAVLEALRP